MCDCFKEIEELKTALIIEGLKCKIYKQILERKLDMKLDDRTEDIIQQTVVKKIKERSPDIKKKVKSNFKPEPKTFLFLNDEVLKCFGEFNIETIKDEIQANFERLKDTRNYSHVLNSIKTNRAYMQTELDPREYALITQDHISRMKTIFLEKGFNDKKIQGFLPKFLSPLEYRLTQSSGFEKQTIEFEDISKFKLCQKISADYPKEYVPFDNFGFNQYFLTYCVSFSSIKELLEMYIENPYGFKNIIYLPDQEYTFYTLNKIENNKRFWKMDCRLEHITLELMDNIKNYCITLFRTIYKSCFNTNNYIPDYKTKYQILEFDCEQILQNVFLCANFKKFNKMIMETVKTLCTYSPVSCDKFDLSSDDNEPIQHDEEKMDVIKLLFDNVVDNKIIDFFN